MSLLRDNHLFQFSCEIRREVTLVARLMSALKRNYRGVQFSPSRADDWSMLQFATSQVSENTVLCQLDEFIVENWSRKLI